MTRKTLRRLDATEADTLRVICDYLDVQQRQGKLLYIRHNPPMMTSKRVGGKTKVIFKKVRETQLGAPDVIVFRKILLPFGCHYTEVFCREVKSAEGRQSNDQYLWAQRAINQGCQYLI